MNTILLLFLLVTQSVAADTDYLFVFYDAGETHALTPVIRTMEARGEDYQVLVMATARQEVKKLGIPVERLIDLNSDLKIGPWVDNALWERCQRLPVGELKPLRALNARVVVTGVASTVQFQIAQTLRESGSLIAAYYDNVYFKVSDNPARTIIEPFLSIADLFLVPSKTIGDALDGPVRVVGQPTLSEWARRLPEIDAKAVRERLQIRDSERVLVFCGGYGDDYPETFRLFAQSIVGLTGARIIVTPHPKVDGTFEKSVLSEHHLSAVICDKDRVTTQEAVSLADVVICHQSTVAAQALFAGKSIIHVALPESTFTTFAIEAGIAQRVTTPAQFRDALEAIESHSARSVGELYQKAGIPEDAVDCIYQAIHEWTPSEAVKKCYLNWEYSIPAGCIHALLKPQYAYS